LYNVLKDPEQLVLLREFMKLQKDMMIMLLSMLEGLIDSFISLSYVLYHVRLCCCPCLKVW